MHPSSQVTERPVRTHAAARTKPTNEGTSRSSAAASSIARVSDLRGAALAVGDACSLPYRRQVDAR